jgi:hypothetical protein
MTNPLLQPDDRFRRASVVDAQGKNRFADDATVGSASSANASNPLAAPADSTQPAYQPQFQTAYPHRGRFVAWLGTLGFLLCWCLLLVYVSQVMLGMAAAILGISLSLAGVVLGYQELSGMTTGAIDPAGRSSALLGYRLGLAGVVLGIGAVLCVIALIMRGIVEFN